jgi:hypothetical protein
MCNPWSIYLNSYSVSFHYLVLHKRYFSKEKIVVGFTFKPGNLLQPERPCCLDAAAA